MKTILLVATQPLEDGPQLPVQAIERYRASGHRLYVACPVQGDGEPLRAHVGASGVLPLFGGGSWLSLLANLRRVSYWARRWRPELYLSLSPRAALLAHSGRGSNGGYGLSLLYLTDPPQGVVARHAFHETDRVVVERAALAEYLKLNLNARGGDLSVLERLTPDALVALSLAYFAEPPGVLS